MWLAHGGWLAVLYVSTGSPLLLFSVRFIQHTVNFIPEEKSMNNELIMCPTYFHECQTELPESNYSKTLVKLNYLNNSHKGRVQLGVSI